jgi:hypothetical protein
MKALMILGAFFALAISADDFSNVKVGFSQGGDELYVKDGGKIKLEAGSVVEGPLALDGSLALDANSVEVGDVGFLNYADVTITTAQVLALNATPITLVAAPGAGKALIFQGAHLFLDFNSVAYDGIHADEDLSIKYTNASGAQLALVETTGFLGASADARRFVYPASTAAITPVPNAPLVLHLLVGEVATGNSPLKVRVYYKVINADL